MRNLDHALRYAALGIPVMPLFEPNPRSVAQLHHVGGGIVRGRAKTPGERVGGY